MLNSYIENKGLTQTLIRNNGKNSFNQVNWNADYDGNIANLSLTSNTDGNKKYFDISLDNEDLATILNVPSIDMPLDKRLKKDFISPTFRHKPIVYQIELPKLSTTELQHTKHSYINKDYIDSYTSRDTDKPIILVSKPTNYLSSPLSNEELIVPIAIDEKTVDNYSFTPRKRHRHKKTHKTYKVYKKPKSYSKSKSKSYRIKSNEFSLF